MILKASQRGGGKQLALHFLKTEDNEHVQVHEIRGFVSDDIIGAMKEAHAVSKGTRCKQFLFSVSLNPPKNENVSIDVFEDALNRIGERTGLNGHPRIVVFYEKEARRHCHAVWSRIDEETMTAVNLSHCALIIPRPEIPATLTMAGLDPANQFARIHGRIKSGHPRAKETLRATSWFPGYVNGFAGGSFAARTRRGWVAGSSRAMVRFGGGAGFPGFEVT